MNNKNFDTIPLCIKSWTQLHLGWGKFGVCPNSFSYDFGDIQNFPSDADIIKEVSNHEHCVQRRTFLGEGNVFETCATCSAYANGFSLRQALPLELDILTRIEDPLQRIRAGENFAIAINSLINKEKIISHNPISITVSCASACNIRCKFCYNCQMDYHPKPEDILNIIDKVHETLTFINLMGGEPLVTKTGRAILAKFAEDKYKFAVRLGTNGQWTDFNLLKPVNLVDVQISTDAATKEIYESVRIGGDFDDLINNIKKFVEFKKEKPLMKITTAFTVTSDNYTDIAEACKLYQDLGAFTSFHLVMREKDDPQNIKERPDLYEPLLKKIDEALAVAEHPITKDKLIALQNTILFKMNNKEKIKTSRSYKKYIPLPVKKFIRKHLIKPPPPPPPPRRNNWKQRACCDLYNAKIFSIKSYPPEYFTKCKAV